MNTDIYSNHKDKGYKNPQKPKANVCTILTPKTTPKVKFFYNTIQPNLIIT